MKRKLIVEQWLSLDGCVADPTGSLAFFVPHVRESYTVRTDHVQAIDTLLFGRKTYEQFSSLWPDRPVENDPLVKKINTAGKIVFSSTLKSAPWGKWPSAKVETEVLNTVRTLKTSPGGNIVLWGSISLAQTLMKENLVDEYLLHLCPALTGGGRKLFTDEMPASELSLIGTKEYSKGVILLHYKNLNHE